MAIECGANWRDLIDDNYNPSFAKIQLHEQYKKEQKICLNCSNLKDEHSKLVLEIKNQNKFLTEKSQKLREQLV